MPEPKIVDLIDGSFTLWHAEAMRVTGLSTERLLNWYKRKLLSPELSYSKVPGNRRSYSVPAACALALFRALSDAGIDLVDIASLLRLLFREAGRSAAWLSHITPAEAMALLSSCASQSDFIIDDQRCSPEASDEQYREYLDEFSPLSLPDEEKELLAAKHAEDRKRRADFAREHGLNLADPLGEGLALIIRRSPEADREFSGNFIGKPVVGPYLKSAHYHCAFVQSGRVCEIELRGWLRRIGIRNCVLFDYQLVFFECLAMIAEVLGSRVAE